MSKKKEIQQAERINAADVVAVYDELDHKGCCFHYRV